MFLRKLHPELKEELEQFKIHLKESSREIASLKVWQLQGYFFIIDFYVTEEEVNNLAVEEIAAHFVKC